MPGDSTEEILFKIGVYENPNNAGRLEALAKQIADMQKTMSAGAGSVGTAAAVAGGEVESVTGQAEQHIEEMKESVDELLPHMRNVFAQLSDVSEEHAAKMAGALERELSEVPGSASVVTRQLREAYQQRMVEHSEMYAEMAGDVDGYLARNGTSSQKIAANLQKAERSLHEYREAGLEAYEQVDQATIKGVRSTLQMVKGVAELGLMSEENVQKFMQSMAVIQGVFDIFEGGADLLEAFNNGYRAMAKAKTATNALSKAEAALNTVQFAQLKAYNVALLEEAAAANTAAAAEARLSAARGVGGLKSGVRGVAGKVAEGVADRVGSGVAGRVVGGAGGAAVTGVGGVAAAGGMTAIVTTMAAAGAALAAVGLVAKLLTEALTGTTEKSRSWTKSIVESEVGMATWAMRMTGLFKSMDSPAVKFAQALSGAQDAVASYIPGIEEITKKTGDLAIGINLLGDLAVAAATTAKLQKAQDKFDLDKIRNDANFEKEGLKRRAGFESETTQFQNEANKKRNLAANVGSTDAKMSIESQIQAEAQTRLAMEQRIIDDFRNGVSMSDEAIQNAQANVARLKAEVEQSVLRQNALAGSQVGGQLATEQEIEAEAAQKALFYREKAAKMQDGQIGTFEEYKEALGEAEKYEAQIVDSQAKQLELQRRLTDEKVGGEQKYQELLRSTFEEQSSQIKAIEDQRRSAAANFSKLGNLEKDMAKRAIEQARAGKADSLTDEQRDLLRQVGTSEAMRFADQADQAEAKRFGFDQTFGAGLDAERKAMEATRAQLEAKLVTSYDVQVSMQFDTAKLAEQVAKQANDIMDKRTEQLLVEIQRKLKSAVGEVNQAANSRLIEQSQAIKAAGRG